MAEADGYWGEGYYGEGYWGEGYWGVTAAAVAAVTQPGIIGRPVPKPPLSGYILYLFKRWLEIHVKQS